MPLEPKAFNLLVLMVHRPSHLFSKQEIFEAIWPDTAVTDHALTRVIAQLRRGFGDEAREATYIETVPTRGYRWIRPVERFDAEPARLSPRPSNHPSSVPRPAGRTRVRRRDAVDGPDGDLPLSRSPGWLDSSRPRDGAQRAPALSAFGNGRQARCGLASSNHRSRWSRPASGVSPQGDAIAYVSDRTGAFEIYVRALSGTAMIRR